MFFLKYILLILIFLFSTFLGFLLSKKYKNRVTELKVFKDSLNILESKMKFTYEPLGEIFEETSNIISEPLSKVFKDAKIYIKDMNVKDAWNKSIEDNSKNLNLQKEDIEIIEGLGKMLRTN